MPDKGRVCIRKIYHTLYIPYVGHIHSFSSRMRFTQDHALILLQPWILLKSATKLYQNAYFARDLENLTLYRSRVDKVSIFLLKRISNNAC